jgi:hypothetical protein
MKKLITVLTMLVAVSMAGVAAADILWDQTAGYEGWSMGFFNVSAGAPPFGMTAYTVNDIVVPAGGWIVDTYRVYYDGFDPTWAGAVTSASIFLEPKTGSLPTGTPDGATVVPVTATVLGNGFLEVTAENLGLAINEGEWWIGLTPFAPTSDNIHVSVPAVGDDSPTYDTGGFPAPMWGGWAPGLDGAIMLEGTTGAVATENDTWGGLKAIYR